VVQRATRMALTPLLNTMNVVGIVSIPGMMTGQILGGCRGCAASGWVRGCADPGCGPESGQLAGVWGGRASGGAGHVVLGVEKGAGQGWGVLWLQRTGRLHRGAQHLSTVWPTSMCCPVALLPPNRCRRFRPLHSRSLPDRGDVPHRGRHRPLSG
jgi:hypothetical protein